MTMFLDCETAEILAITTKPVLTADNNIHYIIRENGEVISSVHAIRFDVEKAMEIDGLKIIC